MSKLLALEWDDYEIRAVAGSLRGAELVIEQIWRVALPESADGSAPSANEIGKVLARAVAERGLKRTRTFVSIGRSSIELKDLALPPAPDEELPELVRFQALREFNSLGEDWPLDYLPLPGDPEQPRTVLAAAIPPANMNEIRNICQAANLVLDQVVFRPCAAAALVTQRLPDARQVRLFVDLLAEELDLTVLAGPTPEFMRTARLPHDQNETELQRSILQEVRRTLAAASNRLHGRRIDSLLLCGDELNQTQFAETLERELKLPTQLFDPLAGCQLSAELQKQTPAHHSHFTPLLGLLAGAAANQPPLIDFLHVRKRPEPPSRSRFWLLAGTLAATVMLAIGYFAWSRLSEKDAELSQIRDQISTLEKNSARNQAILKETAEIDKWLAADLPLLLELRALAEKLPSAENVKLTQLTYGSDKAGGRLHLKGVAKESKTVAKLAQDLASLHPIEQKKTGSPGKTYRVAIERTEDDQKHKGYNHAFDVTIQIEQPGPIAARLGGPPAKQPAPARPSANAQAPASAAKSSAAANPATVPGTSTSGRAS
jgi:Tfp pilus assembly PilM family ATPase/Tfp pilus assembly protein PilN